MLSSHWPSKSIASLRVISSSSGNEIEPEEPTSLAEESRNSSMSPCLKSEAYKANEIWRVQESASPVTPDFSENTAV
jgi:hypothetical protein